MKQGKRKGSKRIKKEDMLASVVEFFNQDRKRAFNYKQVAHGVGATTTPQKQMVFQLLEGMAEQNFLIEVSPGKYKANSRGTEVIGRFERRVNGKNHVITDDNESIFIAERNAMHAMDGDRVRVLVYAKRRGHDAEGEVVEIVEKTPQIFVGTLEVQKHFAFLLTDNKVLANDIFIPKTALKGGKPEIRLSCVSPNGPIGPAIRMERSWIYWDLPEKTIPKYMPYWRNSDCRIVTPKQWKKRLIRFLTR